MPLGIMSSNFTHTLKCVGIYFPFKGRHLELERYWITWHDLLTTETCLP